MPLPARARLVDRCVHAVATPIDGVVMSPPPRQWAQSAGAPAHRRVVYGAAKPDGREPLGRECHAANRLRQELSSGGPAVLNAPARDASSGTAEAAGYILHDMGRGGHLPPSCELITLWCRCLMMRGRGPRCGRQALVHTRNDYVHSGCSVAGKQRDAYGRVTIHLVEIATWSRHVRCQNGNETLLCRSPLEHQWRKSGPTVTLKN